MTEGARAFLAFGGAALIALTTVPLARWIAVRTDFLDHPRDYKKHSRSTPYLGGAGVVLAFLISAGLFGRAFSSGISTIIILTVLLAVMGSIDDRTTLHPGLRFALVLGSGLVLWADDIRWTLFGTAALDLPLTLLWVVGLTNAFNLLDNIDGATGATGAVSAAGIGAVALNAGSAYLAAVAFALSGACAAFLVFNLSDRWKIFLGDCGSVAIGFLIASLTMLLPIAGTELALLIAVPLAGVAIFDTSLVVVSRRRRGLGVLTGGRDHSTHRLLKPLGSPWRVAVALALAQGVLDVLALVMMESSGAVILFITGSYVAVGLVLLAVFDGPWMEPEASPAEATREGPRIAREPSPTEGT